MRSAQEYNAMSQVRDQTWTASALNMRQPHLPQIFYNVSQMIALFHKRVESQNSIGFNLSIGHYFVKHL